MNTRDEVVDGLKYFLICLVVIGHMIEPSRLSNSIVGIVYSWIYAFHMPMFIFFCGYFSRNITWAKTKKQCLGFLECYVVWSLVVNIPYRNVSALYAPQHSLWFLLGLIWWKLITCFIENHKTLRKLIGGGKLMTASVVVAILSFVCVNSHYHVLAIQRTLQFYPFFVLGYLTQSDQLVKVYRGKKLPAIAVLLIASCLIISRHDYAVMSLFYHYSGIERISSLLNLPHITTLCLFLLSYLLALAISYSVAVLVRFPKRFNSLGRFTLGIYLIQTAVFVYSHAVPSLCAPVFNSVVLALMTIVLATIVMKGNMSFYITNPISTIIHKYQYESQCTKGGQ